VLPEKTTRPVTVSILARSGDRALRRSTGVLPVTGSVSILARSGDRALRNNRGRSVAIHMFQSSPGLVTGRYDPGYMPVGRTEMFQSSPGLVTGRYATFLTRASVPPSVSILARSGDRALPARSSPRGAWRKVSILARSGDRALPHGLILPSVLIYRFNPRPVW